MSNEEIKFSIFGKKICFSIEFCLLSTGFGVFRKFEFDFWDDRSFFVILIPFLYLSACDCVNHASDADEDDDSDNVRDGRREIC